jgi:hypothetical protein
VKRFCRAFGTSMRRFFTGPWLGQTLVTFGDLRTFAICGCFLLIIFAIAIASEVLSVRLQAATNSALHDVQCDVESTLLQGLISQRMVHRQFVSERDHLTAVRSITQEIDNLKRKRSAQNCHPLK